MGWELEASRAHPKGLSLRKNLPRIERLPALRSPLSHGLCVSQPLQPALTKALPKQQARLFKACIRPEAQLCLRIRYLLFLLLIKCMHCACGLAFGCLPFPDLVSVLPAKPPKPDLNKQYPEYPGQIVSRIIAAIQFWMVVCSGCRQEHDV